MVHSHHTSDFDLEVGAVFPSGNTIPEKLLRISVHFTEPVSTPLISTAKLVFDNGRVDDEAFLPMELWSPDQKILTLLLHPGRVKTGLTPHEEDGFPLLVGEGVALELAGRKIQHWQVISGGLPVPDPKTWNLQAVKAGTNKPMVVDLQGPIDRLSQEFVLVLDTEGNVFPGRSELTDNEHRWSFYPEHCWEEGRYELLIHPRLENACGDQPDEPFEHRVGEGLGANRAPISIPFEVAESPIEEVRLHGL